MGRLKKAITRVMPITTDEQIRHRESNAEISRRRVIVKAVIDAWKSQQEEDRKLRKGYATILVRTLIAQVVAINLAFFLLGFGLLKVTDGTAKTFIIATFIQISALVLVVTKDLFPSGANHVLDLIDRLNVSNPGPKKSNSRRFDDPE